MCSIEWVGLSSLRLGGFCHFLKRFFGARSFVGGWPARAISYLPAKNLMHAQNIMTMKFGFWLDA